MPYHRPNRRGFVTGVAGLAAALAQRRALALPAPADDDKDPGSTTLFFKQPATRWPNALPIGNGRLGACIFGDPVTDRIQLNEESIWDGQPDLDRDNPRAGAAVPKIRELLFSGKIAEAEQMAAADLLSIPQRMPAYQTLGDLHLAFEQGSEALVSDYRLSLDLETAIVTTQFRRGAVVFSREAFVSAPDQVVVVRLTASEPGELSFTARLDRPAHFNTAALGKDRLQLTGQALPVNDNPNLVAKEPATGVRFYAELLASAEGGDVSSEASGVLTVRAATAVTLLLDCATSYRFPSDDPTPARLVQGDAAAMQQAVRNHLNAAAQTPFAELRARHIADYGSLFRRASFSLGPDPNAHLPTDERMRRVKAGADDPQLFPVYFQFGRYLLICSSRRETLAANLQGIWNESVDPPWGCKYTVNINAEMNYWPADRANLSACVPPLGNLLAATQPAGRRVAKSYYGAHGTVVHHNTDLWGDAGPIDGLGGGIWPMGAAWLSLSLADHFDYTGDIAFLSGQCFPALRESTAFLLDYLTVAPPDTPYAGELVTGPSCSPENAYKLPDGRHFNLCMGPTMDLALTRAVFTRFLALGALPELAAVQQTGDAELAERARAALPRLPAYRITHDGRLGEWPEDFADAEPGHRHISHLVGLFPESQITPARTPELARAARATLDKRLANGSGSTGWSRAWITNCMARLHDGEAAHANLLELLRQCTRLNLYDVCGLKENSPFQIDGNLGAPCAMVEMLLQSHETDPATGLRILRILPALPAAWPQGNAIGLRARGAVECTVSWSPAGGTRVALQAARDMDLLVVPPAGQTLRQTRLIRPRPGRPPVRHEGALPLHLSAGRVLSVTFT